MYTINSLHKLARHGAWGRGYYTHTGIIIIIINTLRFLVCVCPCVTDVGVAVTNLRVVCKIIACRVQNYRARSSCHRNFLEIVLKSCCWSGHSELQATRRMPLWMLAIALTTGKNIRLFGVLDQNKTRIFTYVSQRPLSRRAISLGSFTGAVDFVLQLIHLESLGSELQQS